MNDYIGFVFLSLTASEITPRTKKMKNYYQLFFGGQIFMRQGILPHLENFKEEEEDIAIGRKNLRILWAFYPIFSHDCQPRQILFCLKKTQ